ncbi:MAG: hypothetical protein RLZZ387_4702 [Chloroflexota bacterium]|jgi:hypothetical protein
MHVQPRLLAIATALLVVELAIAGGAIPGAFVRNSLGDVLVVPMLYFLLRAVTRIAPWCALAGVLALSVAVEGLQYLRLTDLLGFAPDSLPAILLGTTFSTSDLLMYGFGALLAAALDIRALTARRRAPTDGCTARQI